MISIFAKPPYFLGEEGKKEGWILQRVSSRIRGEEISAYLGANYNQERSDINIYPLGENRIDIFSRKKREGWSAIRPASLVA